jgi:hypothetical protein
MKTPAPLQVEDPKDDDVATLAVRPGQGAPVPNELTSSADEADDDDDGTKLQGELPELSSGGWAVLHDLSTESGRLLNGMLVRVCGSERPSWWGDGEVPDDGRIHVQMVGAHSHSTGQLRVKQANLGPVSAEDGVGLLLNAWLDSGPSTPVFQVPVWEALQHDEAMRRHERALVYNLCQHICDQRGVVVTKINPDNQLTPRGHPGRQAKLQLAPVRGDSRSLDTIGQSSDLRQMPFLELCKLLEALEGVDESRKGFNGRRLQAKSVR